MRRRLVGIVLALLMLAATGIGQPTTAQGGGCAEFGRNIAGLAQDLSGVFGQTTSSNAPLNGVVESEQNVHCG